jgi:LytR cell envelope-related transcriptional attenuator
VIDLVERIGPILGIVAFVGLAVLAFFIFQQAREVRRLREWAGRAPERAEEAAEASLATAEARGEAAEVASGRAAAARTRLAGWRGRVADVFRPAWSALDRRFPFDPRYLLILLAAAIVAAGVLTSGFGVFGEDAGGGGKQGTGKRKQHEQASKPEVAVLNGTQVLDASGVQVQSAVSGLADKIGKQVLKPAGYSVGKEGDAATGYEQTVIMFEPDNGGEANALAADVEPKLGQTEVQPMIQEVRDLAGGAKLVLIIGRDDAQF